MKKSPVKYDEIVNYRVLEKNYQEICSKTKHRNKIVKFDIFHSTNLNSIYNELAHREYKHSKYNIFLISEPKYRIVMSENIRDKIVNHVVSNVFLKPAIYPKLIEENVATRVGKGTNAAMKLCKKYFLRMTYKYGNFYILKFDISKYFYNIDHHVLKDMLARVIEDKEVLRILDEIVDSTDSSYINDDIDRCVNREIERLSKLPSSKVVDHAIEELKKIPRYTDNKGLGIGSLSSQIFAVFYMNSIDHYIKEKLQIKEYVRFMDDGIIFCPDKERLKEIKIKLEELLGELKLELNKKTEIYSSKGGFEFVGYRFSTKNGRILIRIKNATKKRIKRKFKVLGKYDPEKLERVKASYKGMLNYCTTKSFYRKYFLSEKESSVVPDDWLV